MGTDAARRPRPIREVLPSSVTRGGTDLLVAGRSPDLMRGVFAPLVAPDETNDHGVVVVTTRAPPELATSRYGLGDVDDEDGRLAVVDCTPSSTGVDVGPRRLEWTVPSPTDLGQSSIALGECLEVIGRNGATRRHVVYDSLTTVLRSVETDVVLQFAHDVCVANDGRDGLGLFPVYTPSTDPDDLERLKSVFDGLVEVRVGGDGTEVRVRGLRDVPGGWVPLADRRVSRRRGD